MFANNDEPHIHNGQEYQKMIFPSYYTTGINQLFCITGPTSFVSLRDDDQGTFIGSSTNMAPLGLTKLLANSHAATQNEFDDLMIIILEKIQSNFHVKH